MADKYYKANKDAAFAARKALSKAAGRPTRGVVIGGPDTLATSPDVRDELGNIIGEEAGYIHHDLEAPYEAADGEYVLVVPDSANVHLGKPGVLRDSQLRAAKPAKKDKP